MTLIKSFWCVQCAGNIDVSAFDNGCPKNNGGAHTRIGHGITVERIASDLPSNRRIEQARKKRSRKMQSH